MNKKDEVWIDAFFDGKKSGFEEGRKRGHEEARLFVKRFADKYGSMSDKDFDAWLNK